MQHFVSITANSRIPCTAVLAEAAKGSAKHGPRKRVKERRRAGDLVVVRFGRKGADKCRGVGIFSFDSQEEQRPN